VDNPPEDAYGRVTDPERYRVLHKVGKDLITELLVRFDCAVAEVEPGDVGLNRNIEYEQVLRIEAQPKDSAPLTIGFSRFPGLIVASPWEGPRAFPACGCDACNEEPDRLIRDLRGYVVKVTDGAHGLPWQVRDIQ